MAERKQQLIVMAYAAGTATVLALAVLRLTQTFENPRNSRS